MIKYFFNLNDFTNYCLFKYNETNISNLEYYLSKQFKFLKFKNIVQPVLNVNYPEIYITNWHNDILTGIMKILVLSTFNYKNKKVIETYHRTFMYISIHNQYKNNGIGKQLIKSYFEFCNKNNITDNLYLSPYTKEGYTYIRPIILNFAKQYNINIIDTNFIYEY